MRNFADFGEINVLIIGAGNTAGIGHGWVNYFLQFPNCRVIATSQSAKGQENLSNLGQAKNNFLSPHLLDATNETSIQHVVNHLENSQIFPDIILNIVGGKGYPKNRSECRWHEFSKEEYIQTYQLNALADALPAKNFRPLLLKSKLKTYVIMSSFYALPHDNVDGRSCLYRSTKADQLSMNNARRIESLRSQDRVEQQLLFLSLSPGYVKTNLTNPNAPLTVEKSVSGMGKVLLTAIATRDDTALWSYDGTPLQMFTPPDLSSRPLSVLINDNTPTGQSIATALQDNAPTVSIQISNASQTTVLFNDTRAIVTQFNDGRVERHDLVVSLQDSSNQWQDQRMVYIKKEIIALCAHILSTLISSSKKPHEELHGIIALYAQCLISVSTQMPSNYKNTATAYAKHLNSGLFSVPPVEHNVGQAHYVSYV